jgi:hypothetical protein
MSVTGSHTLKRKPFPVARRLCENCKSAFAAFGPALGNWRSWSFILSALFLFGLGLWMRLHDLDLPFDRDGYDEGVYWESLRAMAAGHRLYDEVFCSQPPVFLLSICPFYVLFGQTLWAARFGVVMVSMAGLLGAFLLGKAIRGRIGALAALTLIIADPFYLSQSQRVEAEAPQIALSMLAVGLAYMWWENPKGLVGIIGGACAGATLALSILSKLLGLAALVPLGLLMVAQIWHALHQPADKKLALASSSLAGIAGFLIATIVVLLPFLGSYHVFVDSVITYHTTAGVVFEDTQPRNFERILRLLTSAPSIVASFGITVALLRGDWRIVPLLAWLGATVLILNMQAPLFDRHLLAMMPPILSLAIFGISPIRSGLNWCSIVSNAATTLTFTGILFVIGTNCQCEAEYYASQRSRCQFDEMKAEREAASDLEEATLPGQLVITDDQFAAGRAGRSTPPDLVDTSIVRIQTKYLTADQLIQAASRSDVHAVAFYSDRLHDPDVADFHEWLIYSRLFRLRRQYAISPERELWVKE